MAAYSRTILMGMQKFIVLNVPAANGIIHVIDAVVLPIFRNKGNSSNMNKRSGHSAAFFNSVRKHAVRRLRRTLFCRLSIDISVLNSN